MPPHGLRRRSGYALHLPLPPDFRVLETAFIFFFCDNVLPPEATAFSLQEKNRCKPFEMKVPQITDTFSNCDTLAD